jgi:glycosyltransferase involved in cell wall biosynthesis
MNSLPLLSICIPTYNRAEFLRECLSSIRSENLDGRVEVVVSDNASTDNTIGVLKEFQEKLPIRWITQNINQGFDKNFNSVVIEAKAKYCWVLGDDDVVESDSIIEVINVLLEDDVDLLRIGYTQADINLNRIDEHTPYALSATNDRYKILRNLNTASGLSSLFAYISSFVFKKSLWIQHEKQIDRWLGSHYVHLFFAHHLIYIGSRVRSLNSCLVLARPSYDNEHNRSIGRLMALDAKTFAMLVDEIYENDRMAIVCISKIFRKTYPWKSLFYVAANGGAEYVWQSCAHLKKLKYKSSLLYCMKTLYDLGLLVHLDKIIKFRNKLSKSSFINFIKS